jgi:hypothetical protein
MYVVDVPLFVIVCNKTKEEIHACNFTVACANLIGCAT